MKNRKGDASPIYCRRHFGDLTEPQTKALALIVAGKTPTDVAGELGLPAATIHAWTDDPRFVAMLNRRRKEAWTGTLDTVRGLAGKALKIVADTLDDDKAEPETRLKAAVVFLKSVKLNELAPHGPTDVVQLVFEEADDEYDRAGRLARSPFDSLLGSDNPHGSLGNLVARKLEELPHSGEAAFE